MTGRIIIPALLAFCLLLPENLPAQGNWPEEGVAPQSRLLPGLRDLRHWPSVEPSPLEATLEQIFHRSWFRLDYLIWNIDGPRDRLIGVQPAGLATDARLNFPVTIPNDPTLLNQLAFVPDTRKFNFEDNPGVRGTIGIPLTEGTVEISAFLLDQASADVRLNGFLEPLSVTEDPNFTTVPFSDGFPRNFVNVATTLTGGGGVGSNILLYDRDYSAAWTSDMWGAQANFLKSSRFSGEGFQVEPLIGARYLNLLEVLTIQGGFDGPGPAPQNIRRFIDSNVHNNIFGPQIGLRSQFVHRWFTIGIEPKIALSWNNYEARVRTEQLRTAADPRNDTKQDGTKFAPIAELTGFIRWHLNDSLSFYFATNWMWIDNVSRPLDNISFNSTGPEPAPQGVVVDAQFHDIRVVGISIGGELILP